MMLDYSNTWLGRNEQATRLRLSGLRCKEGGEAVYLGDGKFRVKSLDGTVHIELAHWLISMFAGQVNAS